MTSTSLRLYARVLRMSGGSGAHPAPPGGCGGGRRLHGDQRGSHPPTRRRADRKGRHRPLPATAESGRGRTVRPDQGRRHRLPHGGRSVSIPCKLNVTSTISVKDLRLVASFFSVRVSIRHYYSSGCRVPVPPLLSHATFRDVSFQIFV